MHAFIRNSWVLAVAVSFACFGCRQAPPLPLAHVVASSATVLPLDPENESWNAVPEYVAPLIPQDLVEPRSMTPTTTEVRVRALTDGRALALRLDWDDSTQNDLSKPGSFVDACAVQLPTTAEPVIPAPIMGEPGRPVELSYWSASWQAMVDGRDDSLTAIYPNATVDHYPFEAASLQKDPSTQREMAMRYAPAVALDNLMAGPRDSPVEDLVAEGPATLRPASTGESKAHGVRTASGWTVVIQRPLPEGFSAKIGSHIALAIWNGENREVGARKMRTGWIPLTVEDDA